MSARQRSHDTQTFVIINVRNIPQRDFFYFIPLNPLEQSINSIFFFHSNISSFLIGSNFPARKWHSRLSKDEMADFLTKT